MKKIEWIVIGNFAVFAVGFGVGVTRNYVTFLGMTACFCVAYLILRRKT